MSTAKSEVVELKKKIETLEEMRRTQTQQIKKLQNEAERESKRDRELLQEKNNTLNKEITRLTMLISHNNGQTDNQVDDSVLDRFRVIEAELDDVCILHFTERIKILDQTAVHFKASSTLQVYQLQQIQWINFTG